MHADGCFAVDAGFDRRPTVERRIEHRQDLPRFPPGIGPRFAIDSPETSLEPGPGRKRDLARRTVGAEMYACFEMCPITPLRIIEACAARSGGKPPPGPEREILFERTGSEIRIEVPMSLPLPACAVQVDIHMAGRRERAPDVVTARVERKFNAGERSNMHGDLTPHPGHDGRGCDFVDIDDETITLPAHGRRTDRQAVARLIQGCAPAVRHGETAAGPIGRHVDADMVFGVAPAGPGIPG